MAVRILENLNCGIDSRPGLNTNALVFCFRRILPLLLLALWLPATMHCGLEALGTETHVGGNLCDDKGACDHDSCDLLEGGGYSSAIVVIDVSPVLLTAALPWLDGMVLPPLTAFASDEPDRPPLDLANRPLPGWHFDRRAALLPGAPQLRWI